MPNCTVGVMNGLFYLDEIFYSENSPYLYGIDTLSSINQSKPIRTMEHYVNIMLDSGFKAALYDEREVMQFLLYLPYDLPSGRDSVGKNNLCIEEYEIYLICPHLKKKRHTSDACST